MDLSTPIYDSTQHNNFYPAESTGNALSVSELSGFITQLLSTLELQELGALYYQQLNTLLPVSQINHEVGIMFLVATMTRVN